MWRIFNMLTEEKIKDFYNRIIGYIETDSVTGDKIGKDFYRRIVGYYDKKTNTTKDFYKRIVAKGDILSSLIIAEDNKK